MFTFKFQVMKFISTLAVAICLFLGVTAVNYDKDAEIEALEINRQKWYTYSGGASKYNFQMERICYCPLEYLGPFDIKVRSFRLRRGRPKSFTFHGCT